MSKMSELFYDLLDMLEQGLSDAEIAQATGFPAEAIAIWRADADLCPQSARELDDWMPEPEVQEEDDEFDDCAWYDDVE